MAQQIQLRNDSAAAWEAENPVLAQAEVGVNTTTGQFKIGDGTSTWEELEYYAGGSANVADFVFDTLDGEGQESRITIHNHDMTIRTTRENAPEGEGSIDADISLESADDVWIYANGDDIHLYAADDVEITTNYNSGSPGYNWEFTNSGRLKFPDGTYQTTSYQGITPPAYFLDWREGTAHLPDLNTHFGWNSNGLWFQNALGSSPITSYPIFTDFTIPEDSSVVVEFIFDANTECNNIGVCVYSDGDNPEWDYMTNSSRIAAQFDCFDLKLFGRTTSAAGDVGIPESGLYRVRFAYDPTASTDKVTVSYGLEGFEGFLESLSINEALPAGPYRIGFAADQDSSSTKTYMTYVSINVNDGDDNYGADLDTGNSGASDVDLVIPVAIKDSEGDDFITFTRTSTGTARIATPQDDLSLRSARDITLFAGNEGPGNVYIGWGDAEYTPDSPNRVATVGDVQSLTSGDFVFNDNVMFTEGSMNIRGMREDSALGAAVVLRPNDGQASLYGYSSPNNTSYSTSDWTGDATWSSSGEGNSQVVLNGATALITFLNETFNQQPVRSISINGSDYYEFDGYGGNSENVTLYTIGGAPLESTTVTSLEFRYQTRSVIEVNDDDEEILIEGKGLNVRLMSTGNISFKSNLDEDSEYDWEMDSNGRFQLPGDGYIQNVVNGSGDGSGNDTIKIVPDSNREDTDQYLIIDPTFGSPSHIHIRAGGQQDNSNADLILGGERTNVRVSDTDGTVYISSRRPDTINTYENINGDGGPNLSINGDLSQIYPNSNFSVNVEGTLYLIDSVSYDGDNNVTTITASGVEFISGGTYAIHESNGENYCCLLYTSPSPRDS